MLKTVGELVLDLFTIEELTKKGIKPTRFEWKFNSNNINVIPVLELYDKDKVYKIIEATEFPELLQKILREIQLLSDYTDPELDKHFLNYLEETTVDCSECELKDICHLKDD